MHDLTNKRRSTIARISVVVPAHDESAVIDGCLQSIGRAAAMARRHGYDVGIHVVCDACSDDTPARVLASGLLPILVQARNVGAARALGANAALDGGADWLAFTDADSIVSERWLLDQVALDADAFCGTVAVTDWGLYGSRMNDHFLATYTDAEDHRHIHGANFGISADAYRASGGFQSMTSSEDVALVETLLAMQFRIAWSAKPRVTTSARADYRAPGGFGATLQRVAAAFRETTLASSQTSGQALLPDLGATAPG